MDRPVILCIDDEPEVLRAIERDLRNRYQDKYRIVRAGSGDEAIETLSALKARGDDVALIISDQRMPGLTGTEVLAQAKGLYHDAGLVLLTAYADTGVAIQSINEIGLDRYLSKPWDPPEIHLYPALDDLLETWSSTARRAKKGLRVIGDQWSPGSHALREFLSRNRVPYEYLDVDRDEEAAALVETISDRAALPIAILEDGTILEKPARSVLAEKIGMKTRAAEKSYDLVIVGGGPAGLAAAVYGASEGLSTVMVESEAVGGQAGTSSRIENYLGFPKGLSGGELASRANAQAIRLGAELLVPQVVEGISFEDKYKIIKLSDGSTLSTRAMIYSPGMEVRRLPAKGADELSGAGVYYGAATNEASRFEGTDVYVYGGGNSAGQAAMYLSRFAKTVTIVIRGPDLSKSMSAYLIEQIAETPNITVRPHTIIDEAKGDDRLKSLVLQNVETKIQEEVPASALFIFIGSSPNSKLLRGKVECDEKGFVLTGIDLPHVKGRIRGWSLDRDPFHLETSVPGVFAAGDVRWGSAKRVASAVGEGSVAVSLVHQYLATF